MEMVSFTSSLCSGDAVQKYFYTTEKSNSDRALMCSFYSPDFARI